MTEEGDRPERDVVLIGGSAGAIEALLTIVGGLPADFPAAVLVVVHTSPEVPSLLPAVLARAGALPAVHAQEGERIRGGQIYVAPPDHHITLAEQKILHVRRGPRENGHRPAIDPLFRSAVVAGYAARGIGVLLSGYLDDGAAGLYAVRTRGGIAMVQDPADAIVGDMPANALRYGGADYVLPSAEIGAKLVELAHESHKVIAMTQRKKGVVKSGAAGKAPLERPESNERVAYAEEGVGEPSVFACPECHGVLWQIKEGESVRYRCRVGHAYSEVTLNEELSHAAESALWAAMRALEEKAAMSRRMADASMGPQRWRQRLKEQAETYATHAEIVRRMILGEPAEGEATARTEERA